MVATMMIRMRLWRMLRAMGNHQNTNVEAVVALDQMLLEEMSERKVQVPGKVEPMAEERRSILIVWKGIASSIYNQGVGSKWEMKKTIMYC
jgi:hypothetical protein